jgi:uncharacterized paraquat-inducible protein A
VPLIECPECQYPISDRATVCPRCGHPLGTGAPPKSSRLAAWWAKQSTAQRIGALVIVVAALLMLVVARPQTAAPGPTLAPVSASALAPVSASAHTEQLQLWMDCIQALPGNTNPLGSCGNPASLNVQGMGQVMHEREAGAFLSCVRVAMRELSFLSHCAYPAGWRDSWGTTDNLVIALLITPVVYYCGNKVGGELGLTPAQTHDRRLLPQGSDFEARLDACVPTG